MPPKSHILLPLPAVTVLVEGVLQLFPVTTANNEQSPLTWPPKSHSLMVTPPFVIFFMLKPTCRHTSVSNVRWTGQVE